jgi:SpoIIAA-like
MEQSGRDDGRPRYDGRRPRARDPGQRENVFAIEVVGKLEKDDYEKVLVPAVQKMIDGPGEIRAVFVFGDRYESLTAGATWADLKLYVGELLHRELSRWKRCAIVTELDWLRHSIAMFHWVMPGEVEVFEPSKVQEAIAWAAG